jgi:hypothetical protein
MCWPLRSGRGTKYTKIPKNIKEKTKTKKLNRDDKMMID